MDEIEDGRARNKRVTRRALRAAVLELGLRRSLNDVSIQEIAKQAGVSTRTFFNYFDTKEDAALIELFMISDADLVDFANREGAAGVWAELSGMLTADVERAQQDGQDLQRYLDLHARHPELQARQMGKFASFLTGLADAIATRIGRGRKARLRAEVMAGSCITAVRVGLDQWAANGSRGRAGSHVAAAFAQFDKAFGDLE